ncbi:hypothetical protein P5V15_006988 [Pogonomyrmex californicus]
MVVKDPFGFFSSSTIDCLHSIQIITKNQKGEDPAVQKSLSVNIHPTFLQRWKYRITNGVSKKDKEELLQKYIRPEELEAPILNPKIVARGICL